MKPRPLAFLAVALWGVAVAQAQKNARAERHMERQLGMVVMALPQDARAQSDAPDESADAEQEKDDPEIAQSSPRTVPVNPDIKPNPRLKGYDAGGGAGKRVILVNIDMEDEIAPTLARFLKRRIGEATEDDIVVLRIKTFGGRIDAAVSIKDALLDSKAPTVAFVDHRAISAGALITLACDTIIATPSATIGDAAPVFFGADGKMEMAPEKMITVMRAEMSGVAKAKGRRGDIAEAMVDAEIEIKGIVKKGKLLTFTADQALRYGFVDAIAKTFEDAMGLLNLGKAEIQDRESDWGETVTRILTNPTVSSLLMTFGFVGLLAELYSPGFGIGGIIGVACLATFFFGQAAVDMVGYEEIMLFVIGSGLLALEIFVIPGFGVAGVLGILALGTALIMSMMEMSLPLGTSWEFGYLPSAIGSAFKRLAFAILTTIAAGFIFARYLPGAVRNTWLVFDMKPAVPGAGEAAVAVAMGAEAQGASLPSSNAHLIGQTGIAESVLRPSGVASFGGERIHVLTDGTFVDVGSTVRVISADEHRVLVRLVAPASTEAGDPTETEVEDQAETGTEVAGQIAEKTPVGTELEDQAAPETTEKTPAGTEVEDQTEAQTAERIPAATPDKTSEESTKTKPDEA